MHSLQIVVSRACISLITRVRRSRLKVVQHSNWPNVFSWQTATPCSGPIKLPNADASVRVLFFTDRIWKLRVFHFIVVHAYPLKNFCSHQQATGRSSFCLGTFYFIDGCRRLTHGELDERLVTTNHSRWRQLFSISERLWASRPDKTTLHDRYCIRRAAFVTATIASVAASVAGVAASVAAVAAFSAAVATVTCSRHGCCRSRRDRNCCVHRHSRSATVSALAVGTQPPTVVPIHSDYIPATDLRLIWVDATASRTKAKSAYI